MKGECDGTECAATHQSTVKLACLQSLGSQGACEAYLHLQFTVNMSREAASQGYSMHNISSS